MKKGVTWIKCRIFAWVDDESGEYLPLGLVPEQEEREVFEPPTRCDVCQESGTDLECSGGVYMCESCMGIDLDHESGEESPTILPAEDSLLYGA